jgi:hypothetical protein
MFICESFSREERDVLHDVESVFIRETGDRHYLNALSIKKAEGSDFNGAFIPSLWSVIMVGIGNKVTAKDFRYLALHEIRHYWQTIEKRVEGLRSRKVLWRDDPKQYFRAYNGVPATSDEYFCFPWERDANNFAFSHMGNFATEQPVINQIRKVYATKDVEYIGETYRYSTDA